MWRGAAALAGEARRGNLVAVLCLLACAITALAPAARAQAVVASPTVGKGPRAVAVNPVTNQVYVANYPSGTVSVIDGATNAVTTVTVGSQPGAVAVNPVTDKVYVANANGGTVSVIDGATNTVATVTVGTNPIAVAVNPVTDKVYVANLNSSSVSVIDGATNQVVATPTVGTEPYAVAVNPVTNKVYVGNYGSSSLSVIDGATNAVTTVSVGAGPVAAAVNPVTDKVYVANSGGGTVSVIDGATNQVTSVTVGSYPNAVAVNPVTNKVYVVNEASGTVSVIDGANLSTSPTNVTVGSSPDAVAVNPVTNMVYVVNNGGGTVSVIDGATNTVTPVTVGSHPGAVTVNPISGKVYVPNSTSNTVSVITPEQVNAIPLDTSIASLAGDVTTSRTPSFDFTTSSSFSPNAPPVQGVYYQFDTWQGAWQAASGTAPSFTATPSQPLSLGTHILYAYAVDPQAANSTGVAQNFVGQMTAYIFTVQQAKTSTTLVSDTNPAVQGAKVTFTASVTVVAPGTGTPTGTVTFLDGATALGTGTLDSSGDATFATSSLAPGAHSITAVYGGDANYAGSTSAAVNEQIQATTTTTLSPVTGAVYGSPVKLTATVSSSVSGTPTGTVTFLDGVTTLGTGTLNSSGMATFTTSLLSVGSHTLSASYGGDSSFAPSTSATVTVTVGPAATTSAVASSANPAYSGSAVTFTATVSSSAGTPAGTVTFDDGTTALGTATLDSTGKAMLTTSSLAAGSHSITAVYGGNTDFASSTSPALTETINPATFTLSTTTPSASINAGQSAQFKLTVTPKGDETTPVTFSCSGLPAMSSCSFVPATVTPGSNRVSTTLTLATTGPATSGLLGWPGGRPDWPLYGALGLLPLVGLALGLKRRGVPLRVRRVVWAGALGVGLAMSLAACGGSVAFKTPLSKTTLSTPSGTYSVTVTGTAGSEQITTVVVVKVQ
jgi:YVTN family beta-propeller protein